MRQIGTLPNEDAARTFEDYLLTRGVKLNVEQAGDAWIVWVYDEDDLEQAKGELSEFHENPEAAKFAAGAQAAGKLRRQEEKQRKQTRKQIVNVRERWNRPMSARTPVTTALIALSVAVVVVGTDWSTPFDLCDRTEPVLSYLFIDPITDDDGDLQNGLGAVTSGQVWRLLTPMFIHFGPLHILFNMLWLQQLGMAIESRRGSWRFLLMVLAISALSNLGQYFWSSLLFALAGYGGGPSPIFGGMSGVVFGLFGYIWIKSRYEPGAGLYMPSRTAFWLMAWFVICFTGAVGPIANTAHGVGLMTGMAVGYGPTFWRKIQGR
jgi:GlpG protein